MWSVLPWVVWFALGAISSVYFVVAGMRCKWGDDAVPWWLEVCTFPLLFVLGPISIPLSLHLIGELHEHQKFMRALAKRREHFGQLTSAGGQPCWHSRLRYTIARCGEYVSIRVDRDSYDAPYVIADALGTELARDTDLDAAVGEAMAAARSIPQERA